jgi:SAM-dependent methyltransferase
MIWKQIAFNTQLHRITMDIIAEMITLYDDYYASREYSRRYPRPNRSTLNFLLRYGARQARTILDYGCGNGRYALPLLQSTMASLTGFDVSRTAIQAFANRLQGDPLTSRVRLLCGDPVLLEDDTRYDLIVCLFGVLSHVGERADRLKALQHMRRLISEQGHLLLTVPNLFRRRPAELLSASIRRRLGNARQPLKEAGNIIFTRKIANTSRRFFYHLYTVKELQQELLEAGFVLRTLSPESILPEWMITQSDILGKIDAALSPLLPACLGYGFCAAADPV